MVCDICTGGPPKPIIDKLTTEIQNNLQTEAFKKKAEEQGAVADYLNPQQLAEFTKAELARWGQVVKAANIQPD